MRERLDPLEDEPSEILGGLDGLAHVLVEVVCDLLQPGVVVVDRGKSCAPESSVQS